MTVTADKIRRIVRDAAGSLPRVPDLHGEFFGDPVEVFADAIVSIRSGDIAPRPSAEVGRNKAEAELSEIATRASKLTETMQALSSTSKQAMWNAPPFKQFDGTYVLIEVNRLLAGLASDLQLLQHVVKKAPVDVPDKKEIRGNNPNLWVGAVVTVTAYHYTRLTGLQPNQSKRADGFRALLQTIFNALNISASVERAIKDLNDRAKT